MADTATLERLERRLELVLRDLRAYRAELQAEAKDGGVLGSRGLTQFLLDMLRQASPGGLHIAGMLMAAESAGYAIPTARTMSKRLTEHKYRVSDIEWRDNLWYWKGTT